MTDDGNGLEVLLGTPTKAEQGNKGTRDSQSRLEEGSHLFSWFPFRKQPVVVVGHFSGYQLTMLPLSLLKTAQNHPMLVELKNGETYNGHLVSCDNWMNIQLREVILTSREGDRFWRLPECYIRGSTIKYLRIPDEVIDQVKEEIRSMPSRGRGGGPGRGMGRGGPGRGGGRGAGGDHRGGRGGHRGPPGQSTSGPQPPKRRYE